MLTGMQREITDAFFIVSVVVVVSRCTAVVFCVASCGSSNSIVEDRELLHSLFVLLQPWCRRLLNSRELKP